jgi:Flp pilus assembly protein TadG
VKRIRSIHARWNLLAGRGGDKGAAITSMVMVLLLALFLLVGLTVDGGTHVRGITRAERVATEAARAGLQYYRSSGVPDPDSAVTAAEQYLAAANTDGTLTGTAEIVGVNELLVSVTVRTKTTFLGIVGIDELTATGSGQADLVNTVNGA